LRLQVKFSFSRGKIYNQPHKSAGQRVAGVEVKASATVTAADFRGLRKLKEAVGERFATGVVLYDGEATVSFGGGLFAAPI
jgi:hypothetical protein